MLSRPAPAKVNLGLHVLRRRDDGYHDIETVFLPVAWSDMITVEPEETLAFTCDDEALDGNHNLCVRAAVELRDEYGVERGARVHLAKHLPYGSGLGSGSSDAATTMLLLSELWHLDAPHADLARIAVRLGSDVPFFLRREAAYATGRGEILTPLSEGAGDAYVFPFHLVIALPTTRISTAEAYADVRPDEQRRADISAIVRTNDLQVWKEELVNDFEMSILEAFPEIASLKEAMYAAGAGYAAMSGSGSAVFGVFDDMAHAEAAASALRQSGLQVWQGGSAG